MRGAARVVTCERVQGCTTVTAVGVGPHDVDVAALQKALREQNCIVAADDIAEANPQRRLTTRPGRV